jgi:hypothetical protein
MHARQSAQPMLHTKKLPYRSLTNAMLRES